MGGFPQGGVGFRRVSGFLVVMNGFLQVVKIFDGCWVFQWKKFGGGSVVFGVGVNYGRYRQLWGVCGSEMGDQTWFPLLMFLSGRGCGQSK